MKKILSFISLLLILSLSTISPLYAAAHEKKAEDAPKDASTDAADPEKNKKEDEEEPDCE